MSITTNIIAAGMAAAALGACASGGPKTPDQNPAILAAVQAEPRVIAGETTWVTRGPGYDIVGFTKKDIADVDSAVARESKAFSDVFGAAPPRVVASVHRVTIGDGDPAYQPEPPLPPGDLAPVVEVPVVVRTGNANSRNQVSGGRYGGAGAAGGAPGVDAIPTERVARAWLSARATALTGHPGTQGSTGLIDDPRVPGWAEALVPDLAAQDTTIGRLSVALTADNVGVLPLQQFFTMDRPQATYADAAESGPGAGGAAVKEVAASAAAWAAADTAAGAAGWGAWAGAGAAWAACAAAEAVAAAAPRSVRPRRCAVPRCTRRRPRCWATI